MKRLLIALTLFLGMAPGRVAGQAGPTFLYVVTAVDANGFESAFSSQVTAAFTNVGPTATGTPQTKVALSWTASVPCTGTGCAPVAGYNVYRSKVSGGPYVKVNAALVTGVTYTDSFTPPGVATGLAATVS
jgi:fibronectin type 3 domain-containing protein